MSGTATQYLPLLFILATGFLWLRRPNDRWLHLLAINGMWIPIVQCMWLGLVRVSHFTPPRYDEWFLATDSWFGYPSFAVGRLVEAHAWFKELVTWDYILYVGAIFTAVAVNFALVGIRRGYQTFAAMFMSAVLAIPIYSLVPACGPRYMFSGFPYNPPHFATLQVLYSAANPNCLPSNHMSLALLAAAFVWRWKAGRIIGILHVALTTLATLGLGEHYAIDLIAAVPYAAAIYWLSNRFFNPVCMVSVPANKVGSIPTTGTRITSPCLDFEVVSP
jgi:hypothetical protein